MNYVLCLMMVRHWFCCSRAEDAAYHQLKLHEELLKFRNFDKNMADTLVERLFRHLWYTSEEFVVFALASDLVSKEAKQQVAEEILRQPKGKTKPGKVSMPPLVPGCSLASRIGSQSLHFFEALGVQTQFLSEPVNDWSSIPAYQKFASFVKNVPLNNDHTERIVKRTNDYAEYGSKSEEDYQAVLQAVGSAIERLPVRRTKRDFVEACESD